MTLNNFDRCLKKMPRNKVKVIDLFAGAGGFSVGASQAGAEVVASVELDSTACQTLRSNHQYHGEVLEGDVSNLTGADLRKLGNVRKSDRLIIVGGPPCQAFSKAAYWTEEGKDAAYRRARANGIAAEKPAALSTAKPDSRRDLVKEYMRLVRETNADGFVFENVPSLKHPRNRPILDALLKEAVRSGYSVLEMTANAANFGVAQTRERVIVVGSKRREPELLQITNSDDCDSHLPAFLTAREALKEFDKKRYFEPEEVVAGRWAKHLEEVPPGWNYKAHTAWAGHPKPTFVTETRFWNFLLKLSPERPSWTIAASPGPWTGPFHWKNRRLRTAELAALQGFPKDYLIAGSRRERVRQMGNAIPVPLARAAVCSLVASLE